MDRYTKTVLTVIAGCLLVLVGQNISVFEEARANTVNSIGLDVLYSGRAAVSSVCLEGRLFAVAQKTNTVGTSISMVQIFGGTHPMKCDE